MSDDPELVAVRGEPYRALGQAVSDAISNAIEGGMGTDEAASVAASVAADYARRAYGNAYLRKLAEVVIDRGAWPLSRPN